MKCSSQLRQGTTSSSSHDTSPSNWGPICTCPGTYQLHTWLHHGTTSSSSSSHFTAFHQGASAKMSSCSTAQLYALSAARYNEQQRPQQQQQQFEHSEQEHLQLPLLLGQLQMHSTSHERNQGIWQAVWTKIQQSASSPSRYPVIAFCLEQLPIRICVPLQQFHWHRHPLLSIHQALSLVAWVMSFLRLKLSQSSAMASQPAV